MPAAGLLMPARPRPVALPFGEARHGSATRLHLFHTGTMRQSRNFDARPIRGARITDDGWPFAKGDFLAVPIPAYLVEHPDAGLLLIDTGLHPSVAVDPRENLGRRGAFFMDPCMREGQGLPDQLRSRNIDPQQIRLVLLTHLHVDHVGAATEFPHSTFIVDETEWREALGDEANPSYHRPQFDVDLSWRLVRITDAQTGPIAGFSRGVDLLGDGSVVLVPTPGHSAGHLSVLIRLAGRDVLIAGDAAITRRVIDQGTMPMYLHDETAFRASLGEIRGWAKRHPDALVIPGHDAGEWERLEPMYE